jgi:hypothetical protein
MNGAIVVGASAGGAASTAEDPEPAVVAGRASPDGTSRVAAGTAGLLVGVAAGVTLDRARRRRAA